MYALEGYNRLILYKIVNNNREDMARSPLDDISDFCVDLKNGSNEYKAKYVLIQVSTLDNGECKTIVRANKMAGYHKDIYNPVSQDLTDKHNVSCMVLGGGRIFVNISRKKILVYGYSVDFGKANHEETVNIIKDGELSDWDITYSDEGY